MHTKSPQIISMYLMHFSQRGYTHAAKHAGQETKCKHAFFYPVSLVSPCATKSIHCSDLRHHKLVLPHFEL